MEALSKRPAALATLAVVIALACAALQLVFSLRWPLEHDLPIFLYEGYLVRELGAVPYVSFFEVNAPGTMLLAQWIHALTDGASYALRMVDVAVLGTLTGLTLLVLRAHGWRSGLLASACFAIVYLTGGNVQSLQREYLCMVPLALSIWLTFRVGASGRARWLSAGAVGALAAVTLTIKPTLVLCWLPLCVKLAVGRADAGSEARPGWRRSATVGAAFAVGSLVALAAVLAPIGSTGLARYLEVVRDYYPYYAEFNGHGSLWRMHGPVSYFTRYASDTLGLVLDYRFVALSFLGLALARSIRERAVRAEVATLVAIAACALLYVPVTGKFWTYHRFPLFYTLSLLGGLAVSRRLAREPGEAVWQNGVAGLAVVVALPLNTLLGEYWGWRAGRVTPVKNGRVELVARYLEEHTRPDEPVLALDTTSGALHGMYEARRPMAGRVIYDFSLYHHVDTPFVRALRDELLDTVEHGDFSVLIWMDDTWSRRPNFPALDAAIAANFDVDLHENEVTFYRRRPAADE